MNDLRPHVKKAFRAELDRQHELLFDDSYTAEGEAEFLEDLASMTHQQACAAAASEDAQISYGDLECFERAAESLGIKSC